MMSKYFDLCGNYPRELPSGCWVLRGVLIAWLTLWLTGAAAAEMPKPFVPGCMHQITKQLTGKPFLLVFWSVHCPPCMKELEMLSHSPAAKGAPPVILVSTDEDATLEEVHQVLASYRLTHLESWMFADDNAQRLRYEIDPGWYGELPRAYFYDASHQRIAHSGALSKEQVQAWATTGGFAP